MSKYLSINQRKLLRQHKYIFKKLASASIADRKKILKNAPIQLFQALGIVFKILSDDKTELHGKQAHKIKRYKRFMKSTEDLKTSGIKRKLQGQSGGFLGGLFKVAIPLISSLFGLNK